VIGGTGEFILTNARVVLDDRVIDGTVHVSGGVVRAVDEGRSSVPWAIDCEGDHLLPGLVDIHTDNIEKHVQPRANVRWDGVAAAVAHDAVVMAAGITTVLDSVSVGEGIAIPGRPELLVPMIEGIHTAADRGLLRVDHRLHLRCEVIDPAVVDLFARWVDDPLVRLVSVMDHAPGHRQTPNVEAWRESYRAHYKVAMEVVDAQLATAIENSRTIGPVNRARIADACRSRGLVLASHDDQTEAHVAEAAEAGAVLSEFPTTLAAAAAAHRHGLAVAMGSPNVIRGGSHSGNVAASALAAAGHLDVLASDYVPASLLQAVFRLVRDGLATLPAATAMAAANPARLCGLADRGRITQGLRADLVRVTIAQWQPHVRTVWSHGRAVY
jgi:alpha-D-ribose 1-methylphosphonate 5-triphosphate diphosphatase